MSRALAGWAAADHAPRAPVRLLAVLLGVGCAPAPEPEPAPPPPAEAVAPILVVLAAPQVDPSLRWGPELGGTLVAHLEAGLADLPGVVPEVAGSPRMPGLDGPLWPDAALVTVAPTVGPSPLGVAFRLEVCPDGRPCSTHVASAPREDPAPALAALLGEAAVALDRPPPGGARAAWARPPSADAYATLLEGRAAAVYYGFLPTPDAPVDDVRRDPIRRAVLVDPKMPIASWILGRRELDGGRPKLAVAALDRAAAARPGSVALLAAAAAAADRTARARAAAERWDEVAERAPGDVRFVLPRFESALARADVDAAASVLDGLPARYRDAGPAVAAQVALREARGEPVDEALLRRWQAASPIDPEPVRRRIAALVQAGRYEDALGLLPDLERRGASAAELRVALLVAVGRPTEAADAADAGGQPAVAREIRAAAAVDPAQRAALLAELPRPLPRAEALIASGEPDAALLALTDPALRPHDPRVWRARAQALRALGRDDEADRAEERANDADPLGVVRGLDGED